MNKGKHHTQQFKEEAVKWMGDKLRWHDLSSVSFQLVTTAANL